MKPIVAILGAADNTGSAIAHSLAPAGYRLLLADDINDDSSPSIECLAQLLCRIRERASHADANIVFSSHEASREADIIIAAIPYSTQAAVARRISDVAAGKIVVSMNNPLNGTGGGFVQPTTSAAEELARLLPHARVIKAFNTILASHYAMPSVAGQILDVFVAGDDDEAVATVTQLVRDAGFNPLFAGNLPMSRTLEGMMALLIE
ncbi:MAG TPA: NAD(P)-binding domain-containing protein, partial [Bacteroidota bacterium]|nr:NAD(P)-binding domain-containing protein [Bacteroidota bacterium]